MNTLLNAGVKFNSFELQFCNHSDRNIQWRHEAFYHKKINNVSFIVQPQRPRRKIYRNVEMQGSTEQEIKLRRPNFLLRYFFKVLGSRAFYLFFFLSASSFSFWRWINREKDSKKVIKMEGGSVLWFCLEHMLELICKKTDKKVKNSKDKPVSVQCTDETILSAFKENVLLV